MACSRASRRSGSSCSKSVACGPNPSPQLRPMSPGREPQSGLTRGPANRKTAPTRRLRTRRNGHDRKPDRPWQARRDPLRPRAGGAALDHPAPACHRIGHLDVFRGERRQRVLQHPGHVLPGLAAGLRHRSGRLAHRHPSPVPPARRGSRPGLGGHRGDRHCRVGHDCRVRHQLALGDHWNGLHLRRRHSPGARAPSRRRSTRLVFRSTSHAPRPTSSRSSTGTPGTCSRPPSTVACSSSAPAARSSSSPWSSSPARLASWPTCGAWCPRTTASTTTSSSPRSAVRSADSSGAASA